MTRTWFTRLGVDVRTGERVVGVDLDGTWATLGSARSRRSGLASE